MIIIAVIVLSVQIFAGNVVGRMTIAVGGPISSFYTVLVNNISRGAGIVRARSFLVKENEELKARIEDAAALRLRFDSLWSEHQALLADFGRSSSTSAESVILGNVIAKPPQSPYDVILTDVGRDDGVAVGDKVLGPGGVFVGRVAEITASTAKIVAFSSPREENQVIHGRTNAMLTVIGAGGGNMKTQVPQDTDIAVGDAVLLPRFGGAVIGTVSDIESNVASAFKRVLLKSSTNIFRLRWVEVVKTGE